jgi:RNA polymerase sigma factor (sigma-70 family)
LELVRTDEELLASYVASGDEGAFEELAGRHAGMVYRACLRRLADPVEAQDASQAVFVVLVRKAKSLARHTNLAAWLHTVARHVCLKAARTRADRAKREEEAALLQESSGGGGSQLGEDLDEALHRLPSGQRQAVILRYLEGHSQEDAAKLAGCPVGTLSRRASNGLAKLRHRLARRGTALGATALVALIEGEVQAAIPQALLPSILTASRAAATGAAAGAVGIGTNVMILAEGAMKAMLWGKVKLITAIAGAAVLAGAALLPLAASGEQASVPPKNGNKTPRPAGVAEEALVTGKRRLLAEDKVVPFEFTQIRLTDICKSLSKKSGVRITCDLAPGKKAITTKVTRDTLLTSMLWLSRAAGLQLVATLDKKGQRQYRITTRARDEEVVVRTCDFYKPNWFGAGEDLDLLIGRKDPEGYLSRLIDRIRREVGPASWKRGAAGIALGCHSRNRAGELKARTLVVFNNRAVQEEVSVLLSPVMHELQTRWAKRNREDSKRALAPRMRRKTTADLKGKSVMESLNELGKLADVPIKVASTVFKPHFEGTRYVVSNGKLNPHKILQYKVKDATVAEALNSILRQADPKLTWGYWNKSVYICPKADLKKLYRYGPWGPPKKDPMNSKEVF